MDLDDHNKWDAWIGWVAAFAIGFSVAQMLCE